MALVVNAPSLAAIWARADPPVVPDEKRPSERAPAAASTSPSPPSSRRTSSGSSADTLESSSGNSFGTQQSGGSNGVGRLIKKAKPRQRRRGADIVLHVDHCAFAIHSYVLKRKCRVLYRFITQLRAQNAVGHLASGDADRDDTAPVSLPLLPILNESESDDERKVSSGDHQFVLRQRDPRASAAHGQRRCPLLSRQHLSDRASQSPSPRSVRFPKVRCVAHIPQRRDDETARDSDESRSSPERQARFACSPGKENYGGKMGSSSVRTQPRIALAPKLPFASSTSRLVPARHRTGSTILTSNSQPAATPPSPPPSVALLNQPAAPDAFAVELIGASADAIATVIEFFYSGKTSGLDEYNAVTVTRLCKWFCMEDHLLNVALIFRASHLKSVDDWVDILLCCTNLRSEPRKKILIHHLLTRLMKLSPTKFRDAMGQMPLHRLVAIDDPDLLAFVLNCMVNTMRSMEIWAKIAVTIELWLFHSFRRPFTAPVPLNYPFPVNLQQPLGLLEFHNKFVTWNPVLRLDKMISGIDAYIKAKTLFEIGPFVFQVRLEPNGKPLMVWRVVRSGLPSDGSEDVEIGKFRPGLEPSFTIRGRLTIMYRCSPTDPTSHAEVPVKYSHSEKWYGKWQALHTGPPPSSAPSSATQPSQAEPESEEKTQERESYQEASAPLEKNSDDELDPDLASWSDVATAGVRTPTPPLRATGLATPPRPPQTNASSGSSSEGSPFEPITCHFSGQFFLWGHRLCNLYHFLLVSTLFHLAPLGAPQEMSRDAVQTRMRELPIETLVFVLQSDRLSVPEGETTLAAAVATLCFSDYGATHYSIEQIHMLLQCVRWPYVDLEQIMATLELTRREVRLYELIENQLRDHYHFGSRPRRAPWGVDDAATPYRATTTLVEFQIEAGDRSLSPSKFLYSQD